VALQVEQRERLNPEPLAHGLCEPVQVSAGGAQRVFLDGAVGLRGEVVVEQMPGRDRLGPGGNRPDNILLAEKWRKRARRVKKGNAHGSP
jgi:hypothetical protein